MLKSNKIYVVVSATSKVIGMYMSEEQAHSRTGYGITDSKVLEVTISEVKEVHYNAGMV